MLYPTLNQPLVLLIIFLVGFVCGCIFDLARILSTLAGDIWAKHILDFFAIVISFSILFFSNLIFNLGQFRLYVLAIFLLSFALERFFSKILWTKVLSKWYSSITRKREESRAKRKNH